MSRHGSRGHPPAPFVVGAARSGTTLLRLMLDAHRELAVPPETKFVPGLIEASQRPGASAETLAALLVDDRRWGDFGLDAGQLRERFLAIRPFDVSEAIRAFYTSYAAGHGKSRWGDKTPRYSRHMRTIDRWLPEAHFVHLVRDGRDVRLSRLSGDPDPPSPAHHARRWQSRVQAARRQSGRVAHYLEVRYEDLVLDAEGQLRRICEFLELAFDAGMLDYHLRAPERLAEMARELPARPGADPLRPDLPVKPSGRASPSRDRLGPHRLTSQPPLASRVGRWRTEMPSPDRVEYERVAGPLLAQLGYEVQAPQPPGGHTTRAASRS